MNTNTPLPELLRPHTLTEYEGQTHIVGEGKIISILLEKEKTTGFFPSIVLWGPPGSGKTTLARIIAAETNRKFFEFSAVNTSIKTIEEAIGLNAKKAKFVTKELLENMLPATSKAPLIFIDEIHRFNKAQQDALLPHVESGQIVLIGATTENPSFEVIGPLLSRCRVIVLKQHLEEDLLKILSKAKKTLNCKFTEDAEMYLIQSSGGDARVALNVAEMACNLGNAENITLEDIKKAMQREHLTFDLKGDEFYNTISALHKTMRGSDPDAALYYLARMLEAGQDPLYIARRVIRAASEDIGLADPQALTIATGAFRACEVMGMPECALALAEAVTYCAKAPKSNKLYMAYGKAVEDVKKYGNLPIPLHILNAPTKLMKGLGYGNNYDYSHSATGDKKPDIDYMPEKLKGTKYF